MSDNWIAPKFRQFKEGLDAFRSGVTANPYPSDTMFHREWLRGWERGYFENKGIDLPKQRRRR